MLRFLASPRASSLAVAPAIWLLHFGAVYTFASFACTLAARLQAAPFSFSLLGIAILTTLALAISGSGLEMNARKWRAAGVQHEGGSAAFIARTNVLLHALAIIAMLWVALPGFVLSPCLQPNVWG